MFQPEKGEALGVLQTYNSPEIEQKEVCYDKTTGEDSMEIETELEVRLTPVKDSTRSEKIEKSRDEIEQKSDGVSETASADIDVDSKLSVRLENSHIKTDQENRTRNSPPILNQYISNTCFANAGLQGFASAISPYLNNQIVEDGKIAKLFYQLFNTHTRNDTANYRSLISAIMNSNKYFKSIEFGNMDDCIAFVDSLIFAIQDESDELKDLLSFQKMNICKNPLCLSTVEQKMTSYFISSKRQVGHSVVSYLVNLLECSGCRRGHSKAEMVSPPFILLRLAKEPINLKIDLSIPISTDLSYELVSVMYSQGIHAVCYRKIGDSWFYCNDGYIEQVNVHIVDFFTLNNTLPLGIVYLKNGTRHKISRALLLKLAEKNKVDLTMTFAQALNLRFLPDNFQPIKLQ